MKLIIEKLSGNVYAYRESKQQFKVNEKQRKGVPRLRPKRLDDECDLGNYDDFYMVFDIKKKR